MTGLLQDKLVGNVLFRNTILCFVEHQEHGIVKCVLQGRQIPGLCDLQ